MRFRILGPLEVAGERGPVTLGGPKQRAVLAHLIVRANQVVPTDVLIDQVWGEEPPDAARNSLQSYVSHLRQALGPGRLEGQSPGYVLHLEPDELDASRFELLVRRARAADGQTDQAARLLREALGLWRGPAFADLAAEDSLAGEIARLDDLRLQALEERIGADIESGHHLDVVGELETLTHEHPLHEGLWGLLILALYRSGRQTDALTAYQRLREILADELGADTSPKVRMLHEQILRQDPDLEPKGEPLRGYRLLEQIGEGAFGVVYRATQPQIGREVAIKAVLPELANHPDFVRRFEREAQIVARLEHPHIVPLYDYWREPDAAYLVMRFLRGGSVETLLEAGPLEQSRAASILEQVAAALSAAHRQGIVHRDVKPGNVLLDEEGNAYLTDFGVALDAGSPERSSGTMIRGSPGYLSPEQVRLDPASPQSDIYALGIVAYEMLAGTHPFAGTSLLALLDRHLRDALPSVRDARPELPRAVDDVIANATAKDPGDRFQDVLEMAAAFRAALEGGQARVPAGEIRNPYKGLRAFLEADAGDFFGREAATARLVRRLAEQGEGSRFLAVVGPSGSGKSSVVRAGLVPALRRGAIPGSDRWFVIEVLPGSHPLRELESALLGVAVEPPPSLMDDLERDELGLVRAVDQVLPDLDAELVVVIDQLEEVFTRVEGEEERGHLLASILAASLEPASRIRIITTLRADFYDAPLSVRGFGDLLAARNEAITPMSPEDLERAIVAPADRSGLVVDPTLVAAMIADVVDRPGALPLMQYALTELAQGAENGVLSMDVYRRIGGARGALARRAERLFEALNGPARGACRQLFLRLVTLGEGSEDARRRVRRSEVAPIADVKEMDGFIETFGRHRLLSFDRDPATREPTIEIAHEALLSEWTRLRGWIDEARDDIRTQRQISSAASEWEASRRDESFLLRGARLEQIASWTENANIALSPNDNEYVRAGLARRDQERAEDEARQSHEIALERRSARRLRGLVAVFAAAALIAGSLTIVASNQSERAGREADRAEVAAISAEARRLGAQALVEDELDLSLLLARQALAIEDSLDTRSTLLASVLKAPGAIRVLPGTGNRVLSIQSSADRRTFVTVDNIGGLAVYDATTLELETTISLPDQAVIALHPDGRTLVAQSWEDAFNPALVFVNLIDGAIRVARLSKGSDHWCCDPTIAFAPDGRSFASLEQRGGGSHPTLVRYTPAGRELQASRLSRLGDGDAGIAYSPNGRSFFVWEEAERGNTLRLDAKTLRVERSFLSGRVFSMAPDGRTAAIGREDGSVAFLDLRSGQVMAAKGRHTGPVEGVGFSPDGSTLVTTGEDQNVMVWDVRTRSIVEVLAGHSGGAFGPVFDPQGDTAFTVGLDGKVLAWDLTGDRRIGRPFTFARASQISRTFDVESIASLRFRLEVALSPDASVIAFSTDTGDVIAKDRASNEVLWRTDPWSKGRVASLASRDWLFGYATGDLVKSLAFSPDGSRVAVGGQNQEVVLIDATSGDVSRRLPASEYGWVNGVSFAEDGTLITASDDGRAVLWDIESGEPLWEYRLVDKLEKGSALTDWEEGVGRAEISPDGTRLAATTVGFGEGFSAQLFLYDLATRAPAWRTTVDRWSAVFDWSPDSATVATGGSQSGDLTLWDAKEGGRLGEPVHASAGFLQSVSFAQDGSLIVTAGTDGTVRLYDSPTLKQVGASLPAIKSHTTFAFPLLNHRSLLALSDIGRGWVWALDPARWAEQACLVANRELTPSEWEQFLPGRPYDPACRT